MLLIEDYFIKANYNARQCDFYEPKLVSESNLNRFFPREYLGKECLKRGNLNRFFLMRDRNRRETFSFHSPDAYKTTDEKGNIVQIEWFNGDLETFSYDEKGYVIQYEYYIGGEVLYRKETTSYRYSSDSVRIAEVTNTFYTYKQQYCGNDTKYIQGQEYKVVRDVYEYHDNGKAFKSQRFFTNIPFETREYYYEIDEAYEKYTCEEYLAYEQFYDGKWDILKKRLSYNQEGEIVEVALYTQSSNDNHFERIKELLIEGYNEEYGEAQYSVFYSPQKLDIDYCTLDTFETLGVVNCLGDIRLGSVIFDQEGNIDNGYILSYEGSNFEDSGDWPKYEVGRVNVEGEEEWGYEYDWRGYNWEIRLFENGESNQRIASEVTLSTNEAVSVFMRM